MNKNTFNKHELLKYQYCSNKTIREVVDGLKFAFTPFVTTKVLNKQNVPYEIDDDGVTNVIISPVQYPNVVEKIKIPNMTQWVEKHLTKSVLSFEKIAVPSYYRSNKVNDRKNEGLIFNPFQDGVDKLAFRGNNTIFNYKDKDEDTQDFQMIFEGEENESTFITIDSTRRFSANYDEVKGNILNRNRKLDFEVVNTYYSNDKTYTTFKGYVPLIEVDGGILSLPYGASFSSNSDDYYIQKKYNTLTHNSKRGISFYFGENYFGDDLYKNNIIFNDSSLDINGKRYLEFNFESGKQRNNVLLQNFIIQGNTLKYNNLSENYFGDNYFEKLQWNHVGSNHRLLLGSLTDNPYIELENTTNNRKIKLNSSALDFTIDGDEDTTPIRLTHSYATIFNMYANDVKTYFGKLVAFTGETYFQDFVTVNAVISLNQKAYFNKKVGMLEDLYVAGDIVADSSSYFGINVTGYGKGIFHKGLVSNGGLILNSTDGTETNPDVIMNTKYITVNCLNRLQISADEDIVLETKDLDITANTITIYGNNTLDIDEGLILKGNTIVTPTSDKEVDAPSGGGNVTTDTPDFSVTVPDGTTETFPRTKFIVIDEEGKIRTAHFNTDEAGRNAYAGGNCFLTLDS